MVNTNNDEGVGVGVGGRGFGSGSEQINPEIPRLITTAARFTARKSSHFPPRNNSLDYYMSGGAATISSPFYKERTVSTAA